MIRFIPHEINNVIGIKAVENDAESGFCAFEINGFEMVFLTVDCNDDVITEGLARAAMNYAANRYAYIAKIEKNIASPAFLRLGFSGEDILSVEIPVALTSGCTCGH
ncbi:MAG: hypothetical protein IKJ41_05890 [Clostridia bacterium]|nr:hypothetical protein [Clostridia bacterium]